MKKEVEEDGKKLERGQEQEDEGNGDIGEIEADSGSCEKINIIKSLKR